MKSLITLTFVAVLLMIGQRYWSGHQDEKFNAALSDILTREATSKE